MEPDLDIDSGSMRDISDELARCLADTFVVYMKTLSFHWNVQGPNFPQLHKLFQEQYEDLAGGIDLLAERIRALGEDAPCCAREMLEMASLSENEGVPDAGSMVRILKEDHEAIARSLRAVIKVAQEETDEATANLLCGLLENHEKKAWMLRATAG
jgi:starvation-inducible DNA-binding protein